MRPDYKADMEIALNNYRRWWHNEAMGRPLLQIYAPRENIQTSPVFNEWTSLAHNLDNPEKAFDTFAKLCRKTFFGVEALPRFWVNLGPGVIATYLGCRLRIGRDTIWIDERDDLDWNEILDIHFNPENDWWQFTKQLTRMACQAGAGKFFTSITDLNGPLNILAGLRGTQNLLTDLIDHPAEVKAACGKIMSIWFECYEQLYRICAPYQPGSITWMGVWFPGRGSDLQSDFAAMISPDMFQEFVIPDIEKQCQTLDQTIYHLDGPGQLGHVDYLLSFKCRAPGWDSMGAGRRSARSRFREMV